MQEIRITAAAGGKLIVARADGVVIESACDANEPAFSAGELLAASLASCIGASIVPLLSRHGANEAELGIAISAKDASLARGFDVRIALPTCDDALPVRAARAVKNCPVLRALNIPVDIHWQMN